MTELDTYDEQAARGIRTLTYRYRELGRLRAGEQRVSRNGKRYPVKLDTFRFTSTDWRLIQRAADLYGGTPSRWEDAPGWNKDKQTGRRQYQVTVEADRILVSIPEQQQLSQCMEHWTAAGCQRRCNGVAMTTGEPCECRAEMASGAPQLCDHVTRVNFVLPNLPGLGVWRLQSHGVFTASELPLQLAMASRYGPDLEWWLRLDPRTYPTTDEHGKPVTFQYGVPVLDTDRTPAELYALAATEQASLALEAPTAQWSVPGPDQAPPVGVPGADFTGGREGAAMATARLPAPDPDATPASGASPATPHRGRPRAGQPAAEGGASPSAPAPSSSGEVAGSASASTLAQGKHTSPDDDPEGEAARLFAERACTCADDPAVGVGPDPGCPIHARAPDGWPRDTNEGTAP
jgi:hypothetical protein